MLCNPIERVFGIAKHRFRILTAASEFDIKTQAKIICGYLAIHNFLWVHDPSDEDSLTKATNNRLAAGPFAQSLTEEDEEAAERQNRIAEQIWEDYLNYTAEEQEEEFGDGEHDK